MSVYAVSADIWALSEENDRRFRRWLTLIGVPVRVTDSAGLRAGSADPIEREGIARAERAAAQADRILALDAADAPLPPLPEGWAGRVLRVRNKLELFR